MNKRGYCRSINFDGSKLTDIPLTGSEKDTQDSVVQKEAGCDQKEAAESVHFQQKRVHGRKHNHPGPRPRRTHAQR